MLGVTGATPVEQQPSWPDPGALARVEEELRALPALTTRDEVEALSSNLRAVAKGKGLLLHAGDCMEPFEDAQAERVQRKVSQLQELACLMRGASGASQVAIIGRIAGQHAKPRSQAYELGPDDTRLPVYRGDAVNSPEPDISSRGSDPDRMLRSYRCSAFALSTLREGGRGRSEQDRVFASHEMLLLPYERALVREWAGSAYATSTHFGWVGERTRSLAGSHVALSSSVRNPVGVKLGPSVAPGELVSLVKTLNPDELAGRLTLISRMGVENVATALPSLVREVRDSGVPVTWICDPMHGNTYRTPSGVKTRSVADVQEEVVAFVRVLRAMGVHPAGLSLEVTPDRVTECVWRPEADHFPYYRSACDPRLDPLQARAVVQTFAANL